MLRILANENVPWPAIEALRHHLHDVAWVAEDQRGASDHDVLARAQRESRLLVAFDKDFGELAFVSRLPASCGVVLFRLSGSSPELDNRRVLQALERRDDWSGRFAIVEDDRIRTRALPGT